MNEHILLLPVLIPFAAGILMFAAAMRSGIPQAVFTLLVTLANLAITILLFGNPMRYVIPWGAFGWELSFRLYHFSAFIILAAAGFALLIALYSSVFMYKRNMYQYYAYLLITLARKRRRSIRQPAPDAFSGNRSC
jgi:NADH-quinone oxidoreductase subunit L